MRSRSTAQLASSPTRRRALIVDDDIDFADAFAAYLDAAGFEVRTTYSAAEGLQLLETETFVPNVAVVDISMPIVDGYALLAIFRAEPKLRDCTFVGMSGHANDTTATNRFDHFFKKPFDADDLISALGARQT